MTARAILVVTLLAGVVAGSLRAGHPASTPDREYSAPSVLAGGTARPGVSPGVLGARMACDPAGTCTVTWETARLPVQVFAGPTADRIDRAVPVATVPTGDSATFPVAPDAPTVVEVVAADESRGRVVGVREPGPGTVRDLGGYRTRRGSAVVWGRWFVARDLAGTVPAVVGALGLPPTCSSDTADAGPRPFADGTVRADRRLLRSWGSAVPAWVRCATRSGDWPVVLFLTAAGVPRETVVAAVLDLRTAEGRPPDRAAVDRPLDRVLARFGSFRRYLRRGLGLSGPELARFRRAAVGSSG